MGFSLSMSFVLAEVAEVGVDNLQPQVPPKVVVLPVVEVHMLGECIAQLIYLQPRQLSLGQVVLVVPQVLQVVQVVCQVLVQV
jgi:hypothetical protein